jgi:hypothetical protein
MFRLACFSKFILLLSICGSACVAIQAQAELTGIPASGRRESKDDLPKTFKDMQTKQRLEREKKDHEEMLKRGDEAALLTQQLEDAFQQNNVLSQKDKQKLESLEKIVTKIRKELGGGGDEGEESASDVKDGWPTSVPEAFNRLKETTLSLVDELKKTTRFTISAVAIQSSNSVLKLVKFLRLRK